VELGTLSAVEGLVGLSLIYRIEMPSLDFLEHCATLKAITLNGPMPVDVSGLWRCPSLRVAWLPMSTERLVEVSRGNPKLILGNGEASARDGQALPAAVYSDAARTA
jgi:hypothetical protein